MKITERIEAAGPVSVSRFSPTPQPYTTLVRERVNPDGTKTVVSKKRIYSHILGGCEIVDVKIG